MSKMPAKKKSCFQITSVTQAQVAANSVADDTESLDDPDESRTEDVSSEIFDVSRTDFEPEVCDRSSSEETLNVGESEAAHTHVARQLPSSTGAFNVAPPFRNIISNSVTSASHQSPITGVTTVQTSLPNAGFVQQPAPLPNAGAGNVSGGTSQSATSSSVSASTTTATTTTTTCSSRFRVIKLDHGTGEPFRRGRWTCTEFYEKDSEGSVISRNVDTIRHNSTLDTGADRDSGLGATGGSSAPPSGLSGHGPDPSVETALLAASHAIHSDLQQQQQNYGPGQHHLISGSVTHEAYSNSNSSKTVPPQQQMHSSPHPIQQQNLLMPGLNNGSQQTMHAQKSPGMPPGHQSQPIMYQTQAPQQQQQPVPLQQLPLGHQLAPQTSVLPVSQLDYNQQHLAVTTAQSNSTANLAIGQTVNQGPSPLPTPASGVQGLGTSGEMVGIPGGGVPISQPAPQSTPAHLQQPSSGMGSAGGPVLTAGSVQQQQHQPQIGQYLTQNVPTAPSSAPIPSAPASSVPTSVPVASSNMVTQNTALPSAVGQQQQQHPQMPRNGTTIVGVMGTSNYPTASSGQTDENRRKSEVISQFPAVSGKDLPMKPFIPESLQLAHPAVNSLFGIPIQIDGDEDSASGASVVAIDNKIEQAMDLVKSHLMYAVREEVEVLKEQIKELYERNSILERENAVLKSLANNDQLSQLSVQPSTGNSNSTPQPQLTGGPAPGTKVLHSQPTHPLDVGKPIATPPLQPNVTSA